MQITVSAEAIKECHLTLHSFADLRNRLGDLGYGHAVVEAIVEAVFHSDFGKQLRLPEIEISEGGLRANGFLWIKSAY